MYKISYKVDKGFLRYSMFFHRGPTSPDLRFSKKPAQIGLNCYVGRMKKPTQVHIFQKCTSKIFVFIEEIAFKHCLFTNITKFSFFL